MRTTCIRGASSGIPPSRTKGLRTRRTIGEASDTLAETATIAKFACAAVCGTVQGPAEGSLILVSNVPTSRPKEGRTLIVAHVCMEWVSAEIVTVTKIHGGGREDEYLTSFCFLVQLLSNLHQNFGRKVKFLEIKQTLT
ncbi:hypothetical protein MTO96_039236 [Rhipicephalus appendiculatus]